MWGKIENDTVGLKRYNVSLLNVMCTVNTDAKFANQLSSVTRKDLFGGERRETSCQMLPAFYSWVHYLCLNPPSLEQFWSRSIFYTHSSSPSRLTGTHWGTTRDVHNSKLFHWSIILCSLQFCLSTSLPCAQGLYTFFQIKLHDFSLPDPWHIVQFLWPRRVGHNVHVTFFVG